MKTGPRFFSLAILGAAVLLPKTGWIVRNEVDLLAGGRSDPGTAIGLVSGVGRVPAWAFEPEAVGDPVAKAVSESLVRHESTAERWSWIRPLMRDRRVREANRAAVLRRRAFTSVIPSHKEPEKVERIRGFVKELMPLAVEGERADPFNAF